MPDLLIAATAELNDLAVLRDDADCDRIAEATGQRCGWVVPRGSLRISGRALRRGIAAASPPAEFTGGAGTR